MQRLSLARCLRRYFVARTLDFCRARGPPFNYFNSFDILELVPIAKDVWFPTGSNICRPIRAAPPATPAAPPIPGFIEITIHAASQVDQVIQQLKCLFRLHNVSYFFARCLLFCLKKLYVLQLNRNEIGN